MLHAFCGAALPTGCGQSDEALILNYLETRYSEAFIVYHIRRISDESGTYRFHAECAPAENSSGNRIWFIYDVAVDADAHQLAAA